MKPTYFRTLTQVLQLFAVIMILPLIGCDRLNDIIDGNDGDAVIGKIVVHQTGGFAGISRLTTIEAKNGTILLTVTEQGGGETAESVITTDKLSQLWRTLEANNVFALRDNTTMIGTVADDFSYELTVERGQQRNHFVVYAPGELAQQRGEKRYDAVITAIQNLSQTEDYILADMPIERVDLQILESFPIQVVVEVHGILRDSCTELYQTTHRREGNTVHLQITTKRPKDAICAQVIKMVEKRIPLGAFPPGSYRVIVNGVEKAFNG